MVNFRLDLFYSPRGLRGLPLMGVTKGSTGYGLMQERIKGTEKASLIHTLFHR